MFLPTLSGFRLPRLLFHQRGKFMLPFLPHNYTLVQIFYTKVYEIRIIQGICNIKKYICNNYKPD